MTCRSPRCNRKVDRPDAVLCFPCRQALVDRVLSLPRPGAGTYGRRVA